MGIPLRHLISLDNTSEFKMHLACRNGENKEPLDVYVRSWKEWVRWNEWAEGKNDFNRKYIFSLIDFYHDKGSWLFGGIFEVHGRAKGLYKISQVDLYSDYIGRLMIHYPRPFGWRGRSFRLENSYDELVISQILKEKYEGEEFCGYEKINHSFSFLEIVFRNNRPSWKSALQNIKGVYLITDFSNGKKYVGSAYGDSGIWSRWSCYMDTGHGWNDELTQLIKAKGMDYARKNFKLVLLEYRSMKTEDRVIIERESYWKDALLSRFPMGYNKN